MKILKPLIHIITMTKNKIIGTKNLSMNRLILVLPVHVGTVLWALSSGVSQNSLLYQVTLRTRRLKWDIISKVGWAVQ